MPEAKVIKGPADDARIKVEMRREFFNVMAAEGKVPDWVEAFTYGKAKATGPSQFLKLIATVVDKQQERERLEDGPQARLRGLLGSVVGEICCARNASEASMNTHITISEKFSLTVSIA